MTRFQQMCSRGGKARAAKMSAEQLEAHSRKMIDAKKRKKEAHAQYLAAWLARDKAKEQPIQETRVISRREFDAM